MPRCKKTHSERRLDFCFICLGSTKNMRPINENVKHIIISNNILPNMDIDDERYPSATCATCRMYLYMTQYDVSKLQPLRVFDHSIIPALKPQTRTQTQCDCFLCDFSSNAKLCKRLNFQERNQSGRPSEDAI